jgi:hypothetical protein
LDPKENNIPQNHSNEGTINEEVAYEIRSIALPSYHPEGAFEIIKEGSIHPENPSFTSHSNPLLVELPSTRYIDNFLILVTQYVEYEILWNACINI